MVLEKAAKSHNDYFVLPTNDQPPINVCFVIELTSTFVSALVHNHNNLIYMDIYCLCTNVTNSHLIYFTFNFLFLVIIGVNLKYSRQVSSTLQVMEVTISWFINYGMYLHLNIFLRQVNHLGYKVAVDQASDLC